MEGKDLRFGRGGAALFLDATTGTGTGASNAVIESMTPIGGLAAMFNLLLGCISPGGVGTGLYSLLLLTFIAAFLGALMIGRTPEYLGKKFGVREMQLALFALLVSPVLLLGLTVASTLLKTALDSLGAGGPHGLSEIVYAYASTASDNGSAFAGLNANTPWYNVTTGIAMFFGRFAHAIPILAIAGLLAAKNKAVVSQGTLPTDGALFRRLPPRRDRRRHAAAIPARPRPRPDRRTPPASAGGAVLKRGVNSDRPRTLSIAYA